jgi:hypothetical protein
MKQLELSANGMNSIWKRPLHVALPISIPPSETSGEQGLLLDRKFVNGHDFKRGLAASPGRSDTCAQRFKQVFVRAHATQ